MKRKERQEGEDGMEGNESRRRKSDVFTTPVKTPEKDGEEEEGCTEDDMDMKTFIKMQMSNLPTRQQFDRMGYEIRANTKEIRAMKGNMQRMEQEMVDDRRSFQRRVEGAMEKKMQKSNQHQPPNDGGASGARPKRLLFTEAEIKDYEFARKSLRIWPIAGESEKEMMTNLKTFMSSGLAIDEVDKLDLVGVTRVRNPTNG